jgi:uncharacterized protein YgbK (DUF1537 family)
MDARLLVIADDLTGALDTGVQFVLAGVRTIVAPYAYLRAALRGGETPVLVVDTESRHLPPRRAAHRVAACVRAARARGIGRFFKKTDSTLRGNIGAELAALLSASGGHELFFVPALPKAGRTTRSGIQLVDGVPLHETGFARDPRDPVRGGSIEAIVGSQCRIPVVTVGRGVDPAAALTRGGQPIIVAFDAETDGDLEAIADRLALQGAPRLTAGCSGFAAFLPRLHGLPAGPTSPLALRPPLLVVSGSLHERSLEQVREAERRGTPSYEIDPGSITRPGSRSATARAIGERLRERGVMIVRSPEARSPLPNGAMTLLREMGRLVDMVAEATVVPTIAVFGGDTAFAAVEALGIRALEPLGEISQGVVVSRAEGKHGALRLVTKAGGFGPVDAIDRIRGALAGEA